MKTRIDGRTLLALAATLLFWASAFAGIRAGLAAYSPGHVALLRFLVASATLGVYAVATKMPLPHRRDVPGILLMGFLGITVYHVTLNYGEVTVNAGAASLLISASPLFTALLAVVFLGERLRGLGWLGIAVSFAGVALIAWGEGEGLRFDPGAVLILVAALSASVYFVFQRPYVRRYGALRFVAYAIWAGTLCMLVFAPGLGSAVRAAPIRATLAVVYLGVFPAALCYVTWTYALSRAPASVITSFLYLSPHLATLIAWVWLDEVPPVLSLVGGCLALAGVVLVNTRGR
jgi:drug/metabolite transporter (DMT)-like permease